MLLGFIRYCFCRDLLRLSIRHLVNPWGIVYPRRTVLTATWLVLLTSWPFSVLTERLTLRHFFAMFSKQTALSCQVFVDIFSSRLCDLTVSEMIKISKYYWLWFTAKSFSTVQKHIFVLMASRATNWQNVITDSVHFLSHPFYKIR